MISHGGAEDFGCAFGLDVSKDSQFLLATYLDDMMRLFHIPTLKFIREFSGHNDFVLHCKFFPKNQEFGYTSCNDGIIRCFNLITGENTLEFTASSMRILAAQISLSQKYLLTVCDEFGVQLFDLKNNGKKLKNLNYLPKRAKNKDSGNFHSKITTSMLSYDETFIITGYTDGKIQITMFE